MSEVRSVTLNLSGRELIFLQKVTRQEYHFITDEEQTARLRLRDAARGRRGPDRLLRLVADPPHRQDHRLRPA